MPNMTGQSSHLNGTSQDDYGILKAMSGNTGE